MSQQVDLDQVQADDEGARGEESLQGFIKSASNHPDGKLIPTSTLLRMFGYARRGVNVNRYIQDELANEGLQILPSLGEADFYGEVFVRPIPDPKDHASGLSDDSGAVGQERQESNSSLAEWIVSSLKEDGDSLDFLVYGDTVSSAREKMLAKRRSKLPLFFSEDDKSSLIGTVTYADLNSEDADRNLVELAQTHVHVVPTNDKLFDWIPLILQQGMVYGKDPAGNIVQIYTTKDVAHRLNMLAQMFLRVNELEDLIRGFLRGVETRQVAEAKGRWGSLTEVPLDLDESVYLASKDLRGAGSAGEHVAESFVFSDYIKCFGDTEFWTNNIASLTPGQELDKEKCIRSMNDARIARNAVMHCSSQQDLERVAPTLEALAVWLRKIAHAEN